MSIEDVTAKLAAGDLKHENDVQPAAALAAKKAEQLSTFDLDNATFAVQAIHALFGHLREAYAEVAVIPIAAGADDAANIYRAVAADSDNENLTDAVRNSLSAAQEGATVPMAVLAATNALVQAEEDVLALLRERLELVGASARFAAEKANRAYDYSIAAIEASETYVFENL